MAHVEVHNWREGLSLLQRIKYMMEGQYACDITLKVGEGKRQETIKAHRFILVAGSPYFENLLHNDGPFVCHDIQPDIMKQIIRFLYCEEVNLKPGNVLAILSASKKCQIPQLAQQCSHFLQTNLTPDNVSTILTQSLTHGDNTLADKCVELISENTERVFESNDFPGMSQTALMRVVECDSLTDVTEEMVYESCYKWADQNCRRTGKELTDRNRRDALGNVLFQIRFSSMSSVVFADIAGASTLLTPQEEALLFRFIALRDVPNRTQVIAPFNPRKRTIRMVKNHIWDILFKTKSHLVEQIKAECRVAITALVCNDDVKIDVKSLLTGDDRGSEEALRRMNQIYDDVKATCSSVECDLNTIRASEVLVQVALGEVEIMYSGMRVVREGHIVRFFGPKGSVAEAKHDFKNMLSAPRKLRIDLSSPTLDVHLMPGVIAQKQPQIEGRKPSRIIRD